MHDDSSFSERGKWGAIIVGIVMAVPLSAILANQAPMALTVAIVVGFLAWAGVRSGVLARDEASAGADPLETLQERYAAGELPEEEFERRLERILESEQRVEAPGEQRDGRGERRRDRGERERETATEK